MIRLRDYFGVLKNRDFRSLWISQIVAELAYHMVTFTLVILIYERTQNTLFVSLLVVAVSAAPILFSTIAGIVADSFDRRKVMMLSHAMRFALGVAMMFFFPFPLVLLPITFLLASVAQFFEPAQASSIPSILPEKDLFIGNSFFSFTRYAMFLIGYTAAGPLLVHTSPIITFSVILVLYLAAFFAVFHVRPLHDHLHVDKENVKRQFRLALSEFPKRFKEGFTFMRGDRVVAFLVFQVSFIFAIERGFISLAPAFALDWLDINIDDVSLYIILPTGIGTLVGTVISNILKKKMSRNAMVTAGTLLDGVCLIALGLFAQFKESIVGSGDGFTATIIMIAGLAFFSGFADPFIIVPAQTVVQERTPKEKRGRVFGNLLLVMNVLGFIPIIAIGLLTKVTSVVTIVIGLGVLILIVGMIGVQYWRRFRLEPELQPGS